MKNLIDKFHELIKAYEKSKLVVQRDENKAYFDGKIDGVKQCIEMIHGNGKLIQKPLKP